MKRGAYVELSDDYKKWAEWTLRPKKRQVKLTDYVSGFVVALSAFVAGDFYQYLTF
ncbi:MULTISPECIES: hypothetical protein [unclassified Ruegeria]|uniref:hypothetical protein n=1 Tax=unclassified Ruegeria TaxID=2625375 RepID=UPI0014899F30|nr:MULTISPECIES: hypothetical protein [unclassified Ruegeria]NOD62428.1 hypothetical protein [Ruegeria sp. HKCCD6109]